MKRIFAFALLVVMAALALQGCGGSGTLQVTDVWARTAQAGGTSAVYFVINNGSGQDDTLLSAKTDVAMMNELHLSSIDENGTMQMMPQENVPVPAGQKVEFKQGGLHVMMMNLKQDLKEGDTFPVTLTFEKAGEMQLEAKVKAP